MSDLKLGYAYEMFHSRKGKARVQVDAIEPGDDGSDTWIDVTVLKGHLQGIGAGSYVGVGDQTRVRRVLATFTPMEHRL